MTQRTVLLPLGGEARPDEVPVGLERLASEETGVTDVSISLVSGTVCVRYDYPAGQPMANEDAA